MIILTILFTIEAEPELYVVGGFEVVDRSQFAYQAIVAPGGNRICGGAIIDKKHVLTAAHCIYKRATAVQIIVGNLKMFGDEQEVIEQVEIAYIHDGFDEFRNDIALLRVKGTFQFTTFIKPINLATSMTSEGYCTVSGWGFTEEGHRAKRLRAVIVPLSDWNLCQSMFPIIIRREHFCAGEKNKDSCQGDSGGPLVCDRQLVGIVAFGGECGKTVGIYTNVTYYLNWINYTLNIPVYNCQVRPKKILSLSWSFVVIFALTHFK